MGTSIAKESLTLDADGTDAPVSVELGRVVDRHPTP